MPPQGPYGEPGQQYPPAPQPSFPPQQPAPSGQPGRYDFFMAPPTPQKKTLVPSSLPGGSFTRKIAFILGGFGILIIIFSVIAALLPKGSNVQNLIAITQEQNELIRISTEGATAAKNQIVLNFAMNTLLSAQSDQGQLLTLMAKHGTKVSPKTLQLTRSTTSDQTLAAAAAASNYDPALTTVLQSDLTAYANALKKAYSTTKPTDEKQLLAAQYNSVQLLLKQAGNTSNNDADQ